MKICAVIPCHNHGGTLAGVLGALPRGLQALVVDDGSSQAVRLQAEKFAAQYFEHEDFGAACRAAEGGLFGGGGGECGICVLRLKKNCGKAAALKAGFAFARALGATHALTIDADGQHPGASVPEMIAAARANPDSIIVAARDFASASVPRARRFMNAFSNFWFWAETGARLGDTQCGLRVYPLRLVESLDLPFGGFVFEAELLVKAAWAGCKFAQVKIPALYSEESLRESHYRPVADTLKFTMMNTRLFFEALFLSKSTLRRIALKK